MQPAACKVAIHARRTGQEPDKREDCLVLKGELEWRFAGPKEALDDIKTALGSAAERLDDHLLLVDFGNSVGLLELPHVGHLEIVSGKWDGAHFEWMLQDLMSVASDLPFTADAATALPFDRSVSTHKDVLYHAFVYLRYILSNQAPRPERLLPCLGFITRDPHRQFQRYTRSVPIETATRITPTILTSVLSGRRPLYLAESDHPANVPLTRTLRGYLPEEIPEPQVRSTLDTLENRFVKSFIQLCMRTIEIMRRAIRGRQGAFAAGILADCDWMERSLVPAARHSVWEEVGTMVHVPASSTVLQRRAGYRDAFRHFTRMRPASRVPLSTERVWRLLEAKDIATLYELWCFFSVVRATEQTLGPPVSASGVRTDNLQTSVPWEYEVVWKGGTRLFYNPRFARSGPVTRTSYSVPLRPDIGLKLPNGEFHLLDAKFRVDSVEALAPDPPGPAAANDNAEESAERRGTFQRGDLYKMHTYRDAITDAVSVWVLYPGNTFRFFPTQGPPLHSVADIASRELAGVGALPLLPGSTEPSDLTTVLSTVLP